MLVASTVFKAVLTRLIFAAHALTAIYWTTVVTQQKQLWYLAWILIGLLIETLVSLFYRHGDEYKWVSPSIICYLIATIPCTWIIELQSLSTTSVATGRPTNTTQQSVTIPLDVSMDDATNLIEQTIMLMMILGRWLLPKGSLTRESLSQLLLVNLAMSADIIEFFDILKLPIVRRSQDLTLAILCLWTISLMQFPVNATAKLGGEDEEKAQDTQEDAQPPAPERVRTSVPNYVKRQGRKTSRVSVDLSIRQAPLSDRKLSVIEPTQRRPSQLYTEDLETGDVLTYLPSPARRVSTQTHRQSISNPAYMPVDIDKTIKNPPHRASRDFHASGSNQGQSLVDIGALLREKLNKSNLERGVSSDSLKEDKGNPKHRITMDLIGTLMALFMQDGPFLTFRLFMIAKYRALGYMIVFLTVKNALLLTLQVYKLSVSYCVCHDHSDNDFSPENPVDAISRLNNVQIAVVHEETEASTSRNKRSRRMRSRYDRLSLRWSRTNTNLSGPLFYSRAFNNRH